MALEKITIGKIKAPDVLYFVSFDGDENVYKDQARQMKEFFDHKQGKVRAPSFIKRLILLDLESIPERYGGWNVRYDISIGGRILRLGRKVEEIQSIDEILATFTYLLEFIEKRWVLCLKI